MVEIFLRWTTLNNTDMYLTGVFQRHLVRFNRLLHYELYPIPARVNLAFNPNHRFVDETILALLIGIGKEYQFNGPFEILQRAKSHLRPFPCLNDP